MALGEAVTAAQAAEEAAAKAAKEAQAEPAGPDPTPPPSPPDGPLLSAPASPTATIPQPLNGEAAHAAPTV